MLVLFLLAAVPNGDAEKFDQIKAIRGQSQLDLDWSDAEDRLHGSVRPLDPVATQPIELSVLVGTFQGPDFDGPVTMTLRCEGWSQTQTVSRAKGEKGWLARFTSPVPGDCNADLGFTTTRHKLVHLKLTLADAPLPRTPWYVLLAVTVLAAIGIGVRSALKKEPA